MMKIAGEEAKIRRLTGTQWEQYVRAASGRSDDSAMVIVLQHGLVKPFGNYTYEEMTKFYDAYSTLADMREQYLSSKGNISEDHISAWFGCPSFVQMHMPTEMELQKIKESEVKKERKGYLGLIALIEGQGKKPKIFLTKNFSKNINMSNDHIGVLALQLESNHFNRGLTHSQGLMRNLGEEGNALTATLKRTAVAMGSLFVGNKMEQ